MEEPTDLPHRGALDHEGFIWHLYENELMHRHPYHAVFAMAIKLPFTLGFRRASPQQDKSVCKYVPGRQCYTCIAPMLVQSSCDGEGILCESEEAGVKTAGAVAVCYDLTVAFRHM